MKRLSLRIILLAVLVAIPGYVLVCVQYNSQGALYHAGVDICVACAATVFLIVSAWLVRFAWLAGRTIGHEAVTAVTPIPTPAEISWQLGQEWGRPATVEEVYVVHRMLTDRRNEAAFVAGAATLGGLYLLHKK